MSFSITTVVATIEKDYDNALVVADQYIGAGTAEALVAEAKTMGQELVAESLPIAAAQAKIDTEIVAFESALKVNAASRLYLKAVVVPKVELILNAEIAKIYTAAGIPLTVGN